MPSLFGSRRRGSSAHRPVSASTSSAALAAASSVAGSRPPSNGSMTSAAAAAAALRSATTTPEPVGSIQTKRMIRRGSQSSVGSGSVMGGGGRGGSARPDLQRRGSQGSMTERTFRSPSPGRNNSIRSGAASPSPDVPPVPAIPMTLSAGKQRSASVEPPQQRVASPTNNRGNGRSLSMDRGSLPPPISSRRGNRLSDVTEELERSDSNRNGNVNFSRPRSSNPSSPTATSPTTDKQYTHGTGAWFSEPTPHRYGVGGAEPKADALTEKLARIQAAASGQPSQPSHRTMSLQSAQGSHLNRAQHRTSSLTSLSRPAEPAQEMETVMVYDPNSRTFVPKLKPRPKAVAPTPTLPQAPALKPGQYDPNTRTIVPAAPAAPVPQPAKMPERLALDTDLSPPPRNPARLSPTSSPRSSQLLQYTPSPIHDEPEDFSGAGAGTAVGGFAHSQHQRSSSLDVPARGTGSIRGRTISTSPSPQRARFSPSPVIEPIRHDPPPRDVSPAKSAMKYSPAPSLRTHSPLANFSTVPRSPISETSDTMSQVSQDGLSGRKKKSVHVSFDEQPREIEASTAAASPKVLGRDRSAAIDDLDDEELMKPRPALPSFGSVRKNRVVAEKVTEMAPERSETSSDHAIGGILRNANGTTKPVSPEVTSEEAAGHVSNDSDDDFGPPAAASTPAQILTSSKRPVEKAEPSPTSPIEPIVRDFAPAPTPAAASEPKHETLGVDVPEINLSPPTPGIEESKQLTDGEPSPRPRHSKEIVLPGSWGEENEAEVKSAGPAAATAAAIQQPAVEEVEPILTHSPEEKSPILTPIDEDSDTDDSAAFSDAAEDLSDIEGFASIDAIAASPMLTKSSPAAQPSIESGSPPDSPSVQQASKKAESVDSTKAENLSGDWGSATAYWSQLTKAQRQQIEREHLSSDDEARPSAVVAKRTKKTTTKPANDTTRLAPKAAVTKSAPAHRESQPAQPAMKKSMRAQPVPEPAQEPTRMRRSMRDGSGMAAASLRDRQQARQSAPPEPRAPLQKKSLRPASSGSLSAPSAGAAMIQQRQDQRLVSQDSAYPTIQKNTQPPVVSSRLQKELQQDSDSESSFKRKRRTSASNGDTNRFSMKRSMRSASIDGPQERPISPEPVRGRGKDSFSIRSLSPTGSFFGRKKTKELKESLRSSPADTGVRTLRNPQAAKNTARQTPQRQSKFKSRFADSDSDDDAPSSRGFFKSRFADSDDEDDASTPVILAPVRGIPRRQGQEDGDSTDLEDSDDGGRKSSRGRVKQPTPMVPDPADVERAMEVARKNLGLSSTPTQPPQDSKAQESTSQETNQGSALSMGSLRKQPEEIAPEPKSRPADVGLTPEKKRRGFMGSILRRNRSSVQSVTTISSFTPADAPPTPTVPSNYVATSSPSQPIVPTARPQSPASPGKLVRRSSNQPQAPRIKRGDSSYSTATAPPMVGERSTENWPLPPVPSVPDNADQLGADGRPNTSDGTPIGLQRTQSGHTVRFSEADGQDPRSVYSKRTGKKKKFGLLRRAFKLDD